jgi:predicted transcriptional regulator
MRIHCELDRRTNALLEKLAAKRRVNESRVVRDAIHFYADLKSDALRSVRIKIRRAFRGRKTTKH